MSEYDHNQVGISQKIDFFLLGNANAYFSDIGTVKVFL